jgi:hypothetical protein
MGRILGEQRKSCKRFAINSPRLTFSSFASLCNATTNEEPMHHYAATILAAFSVFIAVWAINEFIEYRQRKTTQRRAASLIRKTNRNPKRH